MDLWWENIILSRLWLYINNIITDSELFDNDKRCNLKKYITCDISLRLFVLGTYLLLFIIYDNTIHYMHTNIGRSLTRIHTILYIYIYDSTALYVCITYIIKEWVDVNGVKARAESR